jgi:vacuolar-type H+-ATPase subunit E/Vma4
MIAASRATLAAALAPVREALLKQARDEADRVQQDAEAAADAVTARAAAEAEQLLAEARRQGAADAALLASLEGSRARRHARASLLAAQREVYEQLRRQAQEAVLRLREEPDYPRLRAELVRQAQAALGPEVVVTDHPQGGVLAQAGGRHVDLSLPALADRAVAGLGGRLERLWAP